MNKRMKLVISIVLGLMSILLVSFVILNQFRGWLDENGTDPTEISTNQNTPGESTVAPQEDNPVTVTKEVEEVIHQYHERYNDLTGYGAIDRFKQSKASSVGEEAEKDLIAIMNAGVSDERLEADLNKMIELAGKTKESPKKTDVRLLHRYFHDLDISLNEYQGSKDVFGVTKSFGR